MITAQPNTRDRSSRPSDDRKRLDIQGLRALAVMVVVVFHLWPTILTGGFVGVDVFFVISGYLITSHLVREVVATGRVRLLSFYARRVRRLLPAAFIVLLACVALTFLFLPAGRTRDQNLTEIAASAIYMQNWRLAFNATDYFGAENTASLVQHYWSLSVEEQFYLVWPGLILLAIFIVVKVMRRPHARRRAIFIALSIVFVVSFVFSITETASNQAAAYFMTPTRAWEFAAGGITALLPARMILTGGGWKNRLASWAALVAIVTCAVLMTGSTPFPGWVALVPVLATAWLLYTGDDDSVWSPQFTSHAGPIQLIGDWSYAIYLWHWPIIITWTAQFGDPTLQDKLVILVLSIALGAATKYLVEDPVSRLRGSWLRPRNAIAFMAVGMAVILAVSLIPRVVDRLQAQAYAESLTNLVADESGCFGAYAIMNNCANPYDYSNMVNPSFSSTDSQERWRYNDRSECAYDEKPDHVTACEIGSAESDVTIAFVGDSHLRALLPGFERILHERNWRGQVYQRNGCTPLFQPADPSTSSCGNWPEQVRDEIREKAQTFDLIVLSAYTRPVSVDEAYVASVLDEFKATGTPILVVGDSPGMAGAERVYGERAAGLPTAPVCVGKNVGVKDACASPRPTQRDWLLDAAQKVGVANVDLMNILCEESTCHVVIGGTLVYSDIHHLAVTFSRTLAPWLGDAMDRAMAP